MVFKCKMCGGTIEFKQGETVGVCDSCGTKQTLPRLDDDKKANLYDRANHFRRNNEYDKAMGIYEQILNEDGSDAEAYWSLVLCRYGIEYVEDPKTHKRVPTVNRAQFTSIYMDEDYKSALHYADGYQKQIYEEEAKAIDEIQKGILEISSKEEPFDVFICYKETDSNGRRTQDSVLANDLYHQLVQEGFKVFFARITLEDKLGSAYEPYIFAALNSAKVMVVLGSKPEYFNAVWVKNEWSRYLALVKNSNGKKMLIPAYKGMDPYDLPEEFSHLQAQDMSKLGFMQDLIRGIKKIVGASAEKPATKETVVINSGNANVAPLLKRAFMFLEDGNFKEADEYCEKVLDQDPENAKAYLGKLLAELGVKTKDNLINCSQPFDNSNNYQKAVRFGDAALKNELKGYVDTIRKRNEETRLNETYNNALSIMKSAKSEEAFKDAASIFKTISKFKDSAELAENCSAQAENSRKNAIYEEAKSFMIRNNGEDYENAIKTFGTIPGWKDSDRQIVICREKIEELKRIAEAARLEKERIAEEQRIAAKKAAKKKKMIALITTSVVCAIIIFVILLNTVFIPNAKYNSAMKLYNEGNIVEAYDALIALNGYKDSKEKANSIYDKCIIEKLKVANVGDYVFFGSYEQDNNTSNGKEEIEWEVLEIKGNEILIISKYALDCQKYNSEYTDITWENCTLRSWLNDTFLKTAFGEDLQKTIKTTIVSADKNPKYSTNPGNATNDKVFLLSITEAEKYFSNDEERKCIPTAYAIAQGAYTSSSYNKDGKATCWWWLRSPGDYQYCAAYVSDDGSIDYDGDDVNVSYDCVRPALWINLDS